MPKKKKTATESLIEGIVKGMQEIKAQDIVVMDMTKIGNAVSDYFIVCHGNSNTQVKAIADSVEKEVFNLLQEEPRKKEGMQNGEWILLDYFDVVVHIFQKSARDFYHIEKLWADADVKEIVYES
jgi:ribosome-associated protein